MTKPRNVSRWPEKGQFWAWLHPLSLIRLDCISEECGSPGSVITAHQWKPDGENELLIIQLMPEQAEFLWWEQRMDISSNDCEHKALMAGDVLIARTSFADGRIEDGRLLFIGPETDKSCIHVLASWEVCESDILAPVYQYGPGHLATKGKTSYDHVLEGSL